MTEKVDVKKKQSGKGKLKGKKKMRFSRIVIILSVLLIFLIPIVLIVPVAVQSATVPVLAINGSNNVAIWQTNADTKVSKDFNPIISSVDSNPVIGFNSCKNDHEYSQIVVSPFIKPGLLGAFSQYGKWWKGAPAELKFNVSDFVNTAGTEKISSDYFQISEIQYVMGEFPDELIPIAQNGQNPIKGGLSCLSLNKNHNLPLWLKMYVPINAESGNYYSNLTVYTDSQTIASISIHLHVYNITIPVQRSTRSAIMPRLSDISILDNYNGHRIDPEGAPLSYTVNDTTNLVAFNWTNFDNITAHNLQEGSNAFDVTFKYYGSGDQPPFDNAFNTSIISYYSQVQAHLEAKGWLKYAYIYIWDEPGVSDYMNIHRLAQLYKSAAPDLNILLTEDPSPANKIIWNDINIWVPIEHWVEPRMQYIRQRQQAGEQVWYYVCLFPKSPYTNIQASSMLLQTRLLGWNLYRYHLDGFLYWQTMAYYHGVYGLGYNGLLDGWLIYQNSQDPSDPYNSTRWDILGDGLEDYECLVMMSNLAANLTVKDSNNPLLSKVKEINSTINTLMPSFTDYSKNIGSYYQLRNEIRTTIEELQIALQQ